MAELRKDPTRNRWVLVREPDRPPADGPGCPFCPGNEARTPPEIAAYRKDGSPPNATGWEVRVVPEGDPYFRIEEELIREGVGMYDKISPRGASELVVESPSHDATWASMPEAELERVLWMFRDRILDLKRDTNIRDITVLKRVGKAGARITHPYSRILAMPIIFDDKRGELIETREYYSYKRRCVFCDMIRQEISFGQRVVHLSPHFLALVPYASRYPYESWVLPKNHQCVFESTTTVEMADLARTLKGIAKSFDKALANPGFEFVLHTAPNLQSKVLRGDWATVAADYHWHIEIVPRPERRNRVGGIYVNEVPPEEGAKKLRDAWS